MNRAVLIFCAMMIFSNTLWAAPKTAPLSASQYPKASLPFVLNQGQFDSDVFALANTLGASFAVTKSGELLLQVPTNITQPESLTLRQRFVHARIGELQAVLPSAIRVHLFYGQAPGGRSQAETYEQVSLGEIYPGIELSLQARPHNIEQIYRLDAGADVDQIRVGVDGAQRMATLENGELALETKAGLVRYSKPLAYQYSDRQSLPVDVEYRVVADTYGFALGDYDAALPLYIDPMLATYLGGSELESNWGLAAQYVAADGELYVYAVGATPSSAASFPQHAVGVQADNAGDSDVYIARLDHELSVLDLTFLGGSGRDEAFDVTVHPQTKAIYVTGLTESDNFPTAPGTGRGRSSGRDVFVSRLSADLASLEQSRYLGGTGSDSGVALFFDDRMQGDQTPDTLYVAGSTKSTDFAGVAGGAQASIGGDASQTDGFAARLSEDLDLLQATYLGGMSTDSAADIAVDSITRTVYVVGQTYYNYRQNVSVGDFPWTTGGARGFGGQNDAYVVHLSADLRQAHQATYLGGSGIDTGTALAIHPLTGDVYVVGSSAAEWSQFPSGGAFTAHAGSQDAFVARLDPSLQDLLAATYFGGRLFDRATDALIRPLASTEIYIAGRTGSSDLPGTSGGDQEASNGGDEAFVARLSSDLSQLHQASYYGGSGYDGCEGHCLAWGNDPTDGNVYIYISGNAESADLPGVGTAVVQTARSTSTDSFVARFDGSLLARVIEDMDQDGVADGDDNCPQTANSDQLDTDRDHEGDACDGDDDNDEIVDGNDNCPRHRNPAQSDGDQDGFGNLCDNCPQVSNQDQADGDNDGIGDACADGASGPMLALLQEPADPVLGDRVRFTAEAQDPDSVASMTLFVDGTPVKTCYQDHCEYETKPAVEAPEFSYLAVDVLGHYSTSGNVPESATTVLDAGNIFDADNDGVFDHADNCRGVANADQADYDGDGVGDACDQCCPGCSEAAFELSYCCMPSYGYGGSCTDDLTATNGRYYWEFAYDLVADDGCGCEDSDGNNPFDRGAVFIENQSPQDCRYVLGHFICEPARSSCDETEDYCIDHNTVREYLCDAGGLAYVDTDCPPVNPVCSDGRCDCPDTDGGEYYFRQGTLLEHTDECYRPSWTDEIRLREYFCGRDAHGRLEVDERTVRCEYGCSLGRCRCEDSDGGVNSAQFGRMGLEEDTCIDARTLSEVYPQIVYEGTGSCEIRRREITCDGLCADGACQPETCEDRVQNQGEDGIDCGDPCELPCDLCSITESSLPSRFDWRDWRGRSWVTPVKNQEQCGSCWAFAAIAAVESKYLIESTPGWVPGHFFDPPSPTTWHLPNLSEQTLVSECGDAWGDCTGGGKNDALDEIQSTGVVDEHCFPYSSGGCLNRDGDCLCGSNAHCTSPRSCPSTCADSGRGWDDRRWYITSHTYVRGTNDVPNVKDALLCHGPLVTCSSDWGHCITIIGWDNDSQICRDAYGRNSCWIIKNSHGIQNGWHGNSDRYDDDYWTVDGIVYIPFDDHDYSYQVRSSVHYVRSVIPATSWVGP